MELAIEGVVQGVFTWAWVKAIIAEHVQPTARQHMEALRTALANVQQHHQWIDQTPILRLSAAAHLAEDAKVIPNTHQVPLLQRPLQQNYQRRKAFLVGINYTSSHAPLKGCVNDLWNVHFLLRHTLQFKDDQMMFLTDDEDGRVVNSKHLPTKANILGGLQWLTMGCQPGDSLIFFFAGYGAQHPQSPGSELHEAYLVPSDFATDLPADFFDRSTGALPTPASEVSEPVRTTSGYRLISMLEINRTFAQLPAGARVTIILDCSYPAIPGVGPSHHQAIAFPKVKRGRVDYRKLHDFVSRPRFLELPPLPVAHTPVRFRGAIVFPECSLHCFMACKLMEWDAEFPLEGTVQGAFTWAFIKAFAAGQMRCRVQDLQQALSKITAALKLHFTGVEQTPTVQLSRSANAHDLVLGA